VLGWLALAATTLLPLLVERPPVALLEFDPSGWGAVRLVAVALVLGAIVVLRAALDAHRSTPREGIVTLGLAGLALLFGVVHYLLVDCNPVAHGWQQELYLGLLNHTYSPPHQFRPLPYGFARLLEHLTHHLDFACFATRVFFTFWFLWASYRLARWALPPGRSLLVIGLVAALYPLSVARYLGQLTDPLSHFLFVLGILAILEDRPVTLAAALFLGVLAKETAVLLVPVYLVCRFRQGVRALVVTLALGWVSLVAFLGARLPLGWRPGAESLNGAGLMIQTNLGLGGPIAWSRVSLAENLLHPVLFLGPFLLVLLWRWRSLDPILCRASLVLTPLVLASNLAFGWLYESRNYLPLVPLLATTVLFSAGSRPPVPRRVAKSAGNSLQ
jgi:hypothetical protein